jgi:CheY-like chemotaxis protein
LSNAVKYNVAGGRVFLQAKRVQAEDGGERLRFTISDTGRGISEDQKRELFQPFNRLGMESSNVEGTGIGLVITRELVILMKGALGFDSVVGQGSSFWFELPISIHQPETTPDSMPDLEAATHVVNASNAAGTVLYVEDNAANVALMKRIVTLFEGVELLSASNAEDALQIARTHKPQLVLMDINLPGLSGIEVLAAMRADPALASIAAVAVSANAMPDDMERALAAGFERYLVKPIEIDQVVDVINAHLGMTQIH